MTYLVPAGFRMSAVHAGLKRHPEKEDMSLIVCDKHATAAGVYTTNLVHAAPVAIDRARTPSDRFRALVINSGNANACTGERGMNDALRMGLLAAQAVEATAEETLVMSTGVIGEFLPMDKIAAGIAAAAAILNNNEAALLLAARGILTTDRGPKIISRTFPLAGHSLTLTGICKGAGMIGPNMATMLGIVMTDARLTPQDAQRCLATAADASFNCISVEGHMSTNDSLVLLASGAAHSSPLKGADLEEFTRTLTSSCIELAKQIPDDGEGATHLIWLRVRGCRTRAEAVTIAKSIAQSALVKTAVAGGDPNWGRFVSAAGYAGVPFEPAGVDLRVNGFLLYERGVPVPFHKATVSDSIRTQRETQVELTLREGSAEADFWTSDLTQEYLRVNTDYTT